MKEAIKNQENESKHDHAGLLHAQVEPNGVKPIQLRANNNGLPDNLKSGLEHLSGYAMDDVKVNYNSPKPAQLNAYAYAQGNQIHLGPGQEKHLPHEAWHVVQQKQGRVQPTRQFKGNTAINDDQALEREADVMGARAMKVGDVPSVIQKQALQIGMTGIEPVQRRVFINHQPMSRYMIAHKRQEFKDYVTPVMQDEYGIVMSDDMWDMVFGRFDVLALDVRVISYSRTSKLVKQILEGASDEEIVARSDNPFPVQEDEQQDEDNEVFSAETSASGSDEKKQEARGAIQPRGIRFPNINVAEEALTNKAGLVSRLMMKSSEIQHYLRNKDCIILLDTPQMSGTPAEVINIGGQVQVTIAPWYFEQVGIGEIVGMLAHEFAVHPMGDEHLTGGQLEHEESQISGGKRMDSHYHKRRQLRRILTRTGNYELWNDGHNQADHLFMTKQDEPRAEFYRQVIYELAAGLMETAERDDSGVSIDDVRAVIISYIGDVAMTVMTNDHKNASSSDPLDLRHAISQVKEYWLKLFDGKQDKMSQKILKLSKQWFDVWVGGVQQARKFVKLDTKKNLFKAKSIDEAQIKKGDSTENQLETMRIMGFSKTGFLISGGANVSKFFEMLKAASAVKDYQNHVMGHVGDLEEKPVLASWVKAISNGTSLPGELDLDTIEFLGALFQLEILYVDLNGQMKVISRGAGKLILRKTGNNTFEYLEG